MTLLQFFFLVSGTLIFLTAFDVVRKKHFRPFHFIVFTLLGGALLVFTLFPKSLEKLGSIFGLERGAEVLVYASIIFLLYFVLILLKKTETNREDISKLIRQIALENAKNMKK